MTNQDDNTGSNFPSVGENRVLMRIGLVFGIAIAMLLFIRYVFL